MSASFAQSARPARAAIAWATRDGIYVEIPCKDAAPLVCRYHKTAEGLAAALNILLEHPEAQTRTIQRDHSKIKFAPKPKFSEDQRQGVREVLKKIGIT